MKPRQHFADSNQNMLAQSSPLASVSRQVSPGPSFRNDFYMEDEEDDKLNDWFRNLRASAHQEQQPSSGDQMLTVVQLTRPQQTLVEEIKQPHQNGQSQKLQNDFMGHLITEEGEQDEYDQPYKSYFNHHDMFNKKHSNLAAISCFATIIGQNTYQKTYQDKLEVDQLINDDRPLGIHRLFHQEDSPPLQLIGHSSSAMGHNLKFKDYQNGGQISSAKRSSPVCHPEDTILMGISPDFYDQIEQDQTRNYDLHKLFEESEDLKAKQRMIKSNIEHSQLKKRKRINSGVSNSSKERLSHDYQPQKYLSQKSAESNADLLKAFNQDVASCEGLEVGKILSVLNGQSIQESLQQAFFQAQAQIRKEDPARLLLRFGLNITRHLFGIDNQQEISLPNSTYRAQQFLGDHKYELPRAAAPPDQNLIGSQQITVNDVISINQSMVMVDSNHSQAGYTQASLPYADKRKIKVSSNWSSEESRQLAELVRAKAKDISQLDDTDISEFAQKFDATPMMIQQKLRKIYKDFDLNLLNSDRNQELIFDKDGNPIPFDEKEAPSGKDQKKVMIVRALKQLPNHKGTGADIIKKIEQIYKLDLKKNSTLRNTLDQTLCKCFHKISQEIALNMNSGEDYSDYHPGRNPSMKDMIITCLLRMKDHKGEARVLKAKMLEIFGHKLREDYKEETMNAVIHQKHFGDYTQNMESQTYKWESNMQKTIAKYKDIFSKSKAEYTFMNNQSVSAAQKKINFDPQIAEDLSQMSLGSHPNSSRHSKTSTMKQIPPFYQIVNPVFPQFSGVNQHFTDQNDFQAAMGPLANARSR